MALVYQKLSGNSSINIWKKMGKIMSNFEETEVKGRKREE
jgi:hypothetical protein